MGQQVILVTGAAGFIGYHTSRKLLEMGHRVVGYDNINSYYDPALKMARLRELEAYPQFQFVKADLADSDSLKAVFQEFDPRRVVNLAAQAGVRYSLINPKAYIDSNVVGFLNILENCRNHKIEHLVYASTSSVYGSNRKLPFSVHDNVDHPISLYAATKKSNELMAHTYSHLFRLPTTGLRFFTVYGPWGRPDMALYIFAKAILEGRPIDVFNHGKMRRDFTYVDDIVQGISKVLFNTATPDPEWNGMTNDPATSDAPYRVYNIGNNESVELLYAISLLEKELGKSAQKNFLPIQAGDVEATFADIDAIRDAVGYTPSTSIEKGIGNFVSWFKDYSQNLSR
jgi:UDP-glucuronate 4-epimerase